MFSACGTGSESGRKDCCVWKSPEGGEEPVRLDPAEEFVVDNEAPSRFHSLVYALLSEYEKLEAENSRLRGGGSGGGGAAAAGGAATAERPNKGLQARRGVATILLGPGFGLGQQQTEAHRSATSYEFHDPYESQVSTARLSRDHSPSSSPRLKPIKEVMFSGVDKNIRRSRHSTGPSGTRGARLRSQAAAVAAATSGTLSPPAGYSTGSSAVVTAAAAGSGAAGGVTSGGGTGSGSQAVVGTDSEGEPISLISSDRMRPHLSFADRLEDALAPESESSDGCISLTGSGGCRAVRRNNVNRMTLNGSNRSNSSARLTIAQIQQMAQEGGMQLVRSDAVSSPSQAGLPTRRISGVVMSSEQGGMMLKRSSLSNDDQFQGATTFGGIEVEEKALQFLQREAELFRPPPPDWGMMSPIGRTRLVWEVMWVCFLGFELWLIPFQLLFYERALPVIVTVLSWLSMIFFVVDLIVNFNTGVVDLEHQAVIMKRRTAMMAYARTWFLFDLLACIPWEIIAVGNGEELFSTVRAVKASKVSKALRVLKILKLLRMLKFVRTMQMLSYMRNMKPISELQKDLEQVRKTRLDRALEAIEPMLQVLRRPLFMYLLLATLAHFFGCIYACLDLDRYYATDFDKALANYYECFSWAYSMLLVGSMVEQEHLQGSHGLATLEIVLLSCRLLLTFWALKRIVFHALMRLQRDVDFAVHNHDAMQYLKARGVSAETQLSVLHSVRTTAKSRQRQANFQKLAETFLPEEVRRSVCEEMWVGKLMSLGLIRQVASWNDLFVLELSQITREELYAPRVIVFKHGDAASAAYNVVEGEVAVMCTGFGSYDGTVEAHQTPPFTEGMWIGEKSLISLGLRRNTLAITRMKCTLLMVPSAGFAQLLETYHLEEKFDDFCANQLWRGLCGRCGLVGDHFGDECPMLKRKHAWGVWAKVFTPSRLGRNRSRSASSLELENAGLARDLRIFLRKQELNWLEEDLMLMEVLTLEELQKLEVSKLRERLTTYGNRILTDEEEQKISTEAIDAFFRSAASEFKKTMREEANDGGYLLFLSHYKLEAGTEAALMRTELEHLLQEETGNSTDAHVFLDSEDLTTLEHLQDKVRKSQNLALLLTTNVLTRPWVLVELVTAHMVGVPVLPVQMTKEGNDFVFPDQEYFDALLDGSLLGEAGTKVITDFGFDLQTVVEALRHLEKRIRLPYSPHRAASIRRAELAALIQQCSFPESRSFGPVVSKQVSQKVRKKGDFGAAFMKGLTLS